MSTGSGQVHICGCDEVISYQKFGITHFIRISNPSNPSCRPSWFTGQYKQLLFGDVFSLDDAVACNTIAASIDDIRQAIEFARQAEGSLLVSCDYGASRSPALAAIILADRLGEGNEQQAIEMVLRIRPDAVPNEFIVRLGDEFLGRRGKLLAALQESYQMLLS